MTINRQSDVMPSMTRRVYLGCGHVYLTINGPDRQPLQVLARVGKAGCCQRTLLESVCRLVNKMLDNHSSVEEITMCLCGLACDQGISGAGKLSCVDALARELKLFSLGLDAESEPKGEHP